MSKISFDGIEKAFGGADSKLSSIGSNMMESLLKGIKSKQTSLNTVSVNLVNMINKAWLSKATLFMTAGSQLMVNLINGIISKNTALRTAVTSSINSAVTSIRGCYTSFYSAGSYLVSGFAAGIKDNTYKAEAQAIAMANAAEKAAKEALKINSPSKVFRAIGYSVPEGFAMGIEKMSRLVTSASTYMTDVALQDVKDSVSNIANLISADMDTQPTIRPVLDLTNVKSGVGTLSSIFNGTPALGIASNIRSINATMNSQNGFDNGDIISAIKDLKSEIGKVQGTTNIIEGVTYGDDSSISSAVQSLVRAATIERRI